jgi:nitrilase
MNTSTFKVAVVQAEPIFFNLGATLKKTEQLVREAAQNGAELILFPESFLPGYPRGLSFGTVVGSRSPEGREHWLDYWNHSVAVPGITTKLLGDMAREAGAWLVMGVTEKDEREGSLYCSLLYFNPKGELSHKHRKLKPTAAERIVWGEGDGSTLKVLNTSYGKMGGLICWENYMPLARMTLYEQGIQVYLAPTADERDSWQASMQHIACEGRCFVLGCNQYALREHYPEIYQREIAGDRPVLSRGGSMIISPLGKILAGPLFDAEGVLYAELDLEDTIKGKMDFAPVGHYARRDVFDFKWKKAFNPPSDT